MRGVIFLSGILFLLSTGEGDNTPELGFKCQDLLLNANSEINQISIYLSIYLGCTSPYLQKYSGDGGVTSFCILFCEMKEHYTSSALCSA